MGSIYISLTNVHEKGVEASPELKKDLFCYFLKKDVTVVGNSDCVEMVRCWYIRCLKVKLSRKVHLSSVLFSLILKFNNIQII